MTKRQLIDQILTINRSARPAFLARFGESDLNAYLQHLRVIQTPRLSGDPHRYDKYFVDLPAIAVTRTTGQTGNVLGVVARDEPDRTPYVYDDLPPAEEPSEHDLQPPEAAPATAAPNRAQSQPQPPERVPVAVAAGSDEQTEDDSESWLY